VKIKGLTPITNPSAPPVRVPVVSAAEVEPETSSVSGLEGVVEVASYGFVFTKKMIEFEGKKFVRVFVEDEVLRNDPTATNIEHAFRGFCGDRRPQHTDVREDGGDCQICAYRSFGAIVVDSFDGSSLFIDETRIPYAAMFGSDWQFYDWKRLADGLRAMRHPDPGNFGYSKGLGKLGDLAENIAGAFQNDRPMTSAEFVDVGVALVMFEKQIKNATDELHALVASGKRKLASALEAAQQDKKATS